MIEFSKVPNGRTDMATGKGLSRRSFIEGLGSAVALCCFPPSVEPSRSTCDELRIASIGCGGQGAEDLRLLAENPSVRVMALCDVDDHRLYKTSVSFPRARRYSDWRVLLGRERREIDAVVVSTPDHMHAPVALAAMAAGKHVYCEKPLAHTLYEVRSLVQTARQRGVVTQLGIQRHAHIGYRMAVHYLRSGAIGKAREAHIWTNFMDEFFRCCCTVGPEDNQPVPDHLHWDLWLGVAHDRSYVHNRYHPQKWRSWVDFGGGALGDLGCHMFDPIVHGLELGPARSAISDSAGVLGGKHPKWQATRLEFTGTPYTAASSFNLTWHDGGRLPDAGLFNLAPGQQLHEHASLVIGEKGSMLLPLDGGPQLLPREQFTRVTRPVLRPRCHYRQWVDACLGHGAAEANFDYAGPLTESILLGVLASQFPGQRLDWDSEHLRITGCEEANAHLRRTYRKGWEAAGLGTVT